MVAIRATPEAPDGDVIVARFGDEVTLKRFEADQLPDNLRAVRDGIEARVPVGFARHVELMRSARPRVRALEKWVVQVLERPGRFQRASDWRKGRIHT